MTNQTMLETENRFYQLDGNPLAVRDSMTGCNYNLRSLSDAENLIKILNLLDSMARCHSDYQITRFIDHDK